MINPLRSEDEAFRMVVIVAVLAAPVIFAAVLFSAGVALGVLGGMAFVGLLLLVRARRDSGPVQVNIGAPVEDDRRRILVVANETLSGRALHREVEYRAARGGDGKAKVFVVCPALNTRVKHWTNEEEPARQAAQKRLGGVLEALQDSGVDAEGDIGDDDPVQAMEDALRIFRADEAIISTHPLGRSNWLEGDVVFRARGRFAIPITHVIVDLEHDSEFVAER